MISDGVGSPRPGRPASRRRHHVRAHEGRPVQARHAERLEAVRHARQHRRARGGGRHRLVGVPTSRGFAVVIDHGSRRKVATFYIAPREAVRHADQRARMQASGFAPASRSASSGSARSTARSSSIFTSRSGAAVQGRDRSGAVHARVAGRRRSARDRSSRATRASSYRPRRRDAASAIRTGCATSRASPAST